MIKVYVIFKKETKFIFHENEKHPYNDIKVVKLVDSEEKALNFLNNPIEYTSDVLDLEIKSEPYYYFQERYIE